MSPSRVVLVRQCCMRPLRRILRNLRVPDPEAIVIIAVVVMAALAVLADFIAWLSHP